MLIVQIPRALSHQTTWDVNVLRETSPCKSKRVNPLISTHGFSSLHCGPNNRARSCPFSLNYANKFKPLFYLSQNSTLRTWLCHSQDAISPENEYRSSRNIAISLLKRYKYFAERGGGDNLKEFISAGVNAYALGCTDEGLRKELTALKESGVEIEAMQTYGGSTSLKSKIFSSEVDECILWLSIIFITILCTPQPTIVRWSSTPPVSDEMMMQWKGFCAIIANAYFMRGMAWLPVKTLQLEQMAVVGQAEEASVVASRMRLVFSTLEVVSPQWPKV